MKNRLDAGTIIENIRNTENTTLKPITDIVALKISKGPYDGEPENNLIKAEKVTAEYISENYSTLDEFYENLSKSGNGIEGIQTCADAIYQYYTDSDRLGFDTIKERIISNKDINLKTIADLVAYKIAQCSDAEGVNLNSISAQTFVAEYISNNFKNNKELEDRISKLGGGVKGLNALAETVYNFFLKKDK